MAFGNVTLNKTEPETISLDFIPDFVFIMTEPEKDQYGRTYGFAEVAITNLPKDADSLSYVPTVLSLFTINNDIFSYSYYARYVSNDKNVITLKGDSRMTKNTFWIAIKY